MGGEKLEGINEGSIRKSDEYLRGYDDGYINGFNKGFMAYIEQAKIKPDRVSIVTEKAKELLKGADIQEHICDGEEPY